MPRQIFNKLPATNRFWNIRNAATAGAVPTIELFGDIGWSKEGDPYWGIEGGAGTFQEFAAELKAIGPVPKLRIEIHSYGGDVVVGKGIYDKLMEHPAQKVAVIYGMCASAATYAAMACQTIQMSANSFIIIHNSTSWCWGTAVDMDRNAALLRTIDVSIANLYAARTGKPVQEIQQIMDQDTWMTGTEAKAMGLVDEVTDPIAIEPDQQVATNALPQRVMNTMPKNALPWFDTSRKTTTPANSAPPIMLNHRTPLMNAADQGGASGPASAPQPQAPANNAPQAPAVQAPAPAPAVQAPANNAPQAPATPAPAPVPIVQTPANNAPQAPAQPDIATLVTNAVNAAVKPLHDEIANLKAQNAAGITPGNLGGSAPAPVNGQGNDGQQPARVTTDYGMIAGAWKPAADAAKK